MIKSVLQSNHSIYTLTALFVQPYQFKLESKMNNRPPKKKKRVGSNKRGGRIFFSNFDTGRLE